MRAARSACSSSRPGWPAPPTARIITVAQAREVAMGGRRRFDKGGEQFYDQISALHKAVRGSDPDAALYWYARMIDGGAIRTISRVACCAWRARTSGWPIRVR